MGSATFSISFTHSVAYVAPKLVGAMREILAELGLHSEATHGLTGVEEAMKVWLGERTLKKVRVEFFHPTTKAFACCFEFDIAYVEQTDRFEHDLSTTRLAARKMAWAVPANAKIEVFMFHSGPCSEVPGWCHAACQSTDKMVPAAMGQVVRGPEISSALRYWMPRA